MAHNPFLLHPMAHLYKFAHYSLSLWLLSMAHRFTPMAHLNSKLNHWLSTMSTMAHRIHPIFSFVKRKCFYWILKLKKGSFLTNAAFESLIIRSTLTLDFVASNTEDKHEDENVIVMKDGTRVLKAATIYGKNATGKSNIVKAIAYFNKLVTEVPYPENSGLLYMPFAFDKRSISMPTTMSVEFYICGIRYQMSIEFIGEVILDEFLIAYFTNRPTCLYHRKYNTRQNRLDVTYSPKACLTKSSWGNIISNTANNCTIMAVFGKLNVEKCPFNIVFDYFKMSFAGIFSSVKSLSDYAKDILAADHDGKALDFLHDMFKHIKYDVDISFNESAKKLIFSYHKNGLDLNLPEEFESKGIVRFL